MSIQRGISCPKLVVVAACPAPTSVQPRQFIRARWRRRRRGSAQQSPDTQLLRGVRSREIAAKYIEVPDDEADDDGSNWEGAETSTELSVPRLRLFYPNHEFNRHVHSSAP